MKDIRQQYSKGFQPYMVATAERIKQGAIGSLEVFPRSMPKPVVYVAVGK